MTDFIELVNLLTEKGWKITTAESCTGGLFSASIVQVADASKVLDESFVTYSEEAKHRLVGVSFRTIENYGVVSEETAAEMAAGAALAANADVGVGITGYAGPGGGDRFASCGTVCFGFSIHGNCRTERKEFPGFARNDIRRMCVEFACGRLIELLKTSTD